MSALETLAAEAGLQVHWEDAAGEPQQVSEDTLCAVLAALGLPAESPTQIRASRETLADMRRRGRECFVTVEVGEPVELPETIDGPATLHLESGESRKVDIASGKLPPMDEPGYHRLLHSIGETVIAVAPLRCFGVADMDAGRRIWGAAAQLPSLRGSKPSPFGDFGTLAQAASALGEAGADLLAISPVHALFPADARRYSPYGPSSRRLLNVLFADPALAGIDEADKSSETELIDWHEAIPHRLGELRRAFDSLDESQRRKDEHFGHLTPTELHRHCVFDALYAHFADRELFGWQAWPEAYHDPEGQAVRRFAEDNREEVEFYAWLQGLAERSLAAAQEVARAAGMACGIVTDLAVGIDPGGSDGWTQPDCYLRGLSVGAPPDLLGPEGQDWGLTTFNPLTLPLEHFRAFRETLAAAMANAGGVRIDHVLGLRRIWVVPHGRPSAEGCYIAFPQADLFNILALESWRNRAIVIGEDLGTVPEGLRDEMDEAGINGMRVLWFERDEDGGYAAPSGWDRKAAAMTSTHDLPTLAGWWRGRDIDWTWRIGRKSPFDTEAEERADRRKERARLWKVLRGSGHAEPAPDEPENFVTAGCVHVAGSACDIALIPLEDLFGVVEQPNLPGTTDQHPNWRRRLPDSVPALLERLKIAERLRLIDKARRP